MTQSPRPILPLGQRPRILQLQAVDKTFNGTVAALQKLPLSVNEAVRIGQFDHSAPGWTHAFTTNPAATCGFPAASLKPGAPADLVICKARNWTELFARPQSDRIVLRAGRAITRTRPDNGELDHLMRP